MYSSQQSPGKHIKLIIFDCDGVLLDSEEIGNRVEIEALKTLNINISEENYQKRFAGVTTKNALNIMAQEAGTTISPAFLKEVEDKIVDAIEGEAKIIPYIYETLQQIKIPKVVASNGHFARLAKVLASKRLTHFFDGYIFSADMVKNPKPAPDLYLYVAQKMLVLPEECLVIEDSPTGIQAAQQAGMEVLGFIKLNNSFQENKDELLQAGALQVFSDMRELPTILRTLEKEYAR
jgi:HAD superfamily hydrolase (TIGR01509 family)